MTNCAIPDGIYDAANNAGNYYVKIDKNRWVAKVHFGLAIWNVQ